MVRSTAGPAIVTQKGRHLSDQPVLIGQREADPSRARSGRCLLGVIAHRERQAGAVQERTQPPPGRASEVRCGLTLGRARRCVQFFSIRQDALVCRSNRAKKPHQIRWNEAKRSIDHRSRLAWPHRRRHSLMPATEADAERFGAWAITAFTSSIRPTTSQPATPSSAVRTLLRCARLAPSWNGQPGLKSGRTTTASPT